MKEVFFLANSNPFSLHCSPFSPSRFLFSSHPHQSPRLFLTVCKHVLHSLPFYKKCSPWIHTFISLFPCITESLRIVISYLLFSQIRSDICFCLTTAFIKVTYNLHVAKSKCPCHLTRPLNSIRQLTTPFLKHPLQSFHDITHSWFSSCLIHSFNKWSGNIYYVADTFLGAWNILKNNRPNPCLWGTSILWKYGRWAINFKNMLEGN